MFTPKPTAPTSTPTPATYTPVRVAGDPTGPVTDMRQLFDLAFQRGASDIHLTEHTPPMLRIDGELVPTMLEPITREQSKRLIYSLLNDRQKSQFERDLELDLSIDVQGVGRFRVNVHMQRGCVEAAFRLVPMHIRPLTELGLPPIVSELTRKPNGLVLITGPTGVGKTTTLAAMVDLINHERRQHIIIIEDPIEYLHENHLCIIKQREVYADTKSFSSALVKALRQDPNVIVIGEMRDLETISTALTAAETGHLVLATLHTSDVAQTIDRILDVFPPNQQPQVKIQLADSLQGIVSQKLLPRCDGPGRVCAYEVMVGTSAVRSIIREHATEQVLTVLQTGTQYGMCTMDSTIRALYDKKIISYETAIGQMKNPAEFQLLGKREPPKRGLWSQRR